MLLETAMVAKIVIVTQKSYISKNIHRFVLLKSGAKERPQSFLLQSIIKPQFGWNNLI